MKPLAQSVTRSVGWACAARLQSGAVSGDRFKLEAPPNLTVLPVAGLLAETIMNVFADDSVSAIFGGENQLF